MSIYWNQQDVEAAIIGGVLIAIASTLNLYFYGKITGMSGIFNSLIRHSIKDGYYWKFSFFFGLISLPAIFYKINQKNSMEIFGTTF